MKITTGLAEVIERLEDIRTAAATSVAAEVSVIEAARGLAGAHSMPVKDNDFVCMISRDRLEALRTAVDALGPEWRVS